MNALRKRLSRHYDGNKTTLRHAGRIAPGVLKKLTANQQQRPDLVVAAWPKIIGSALAEMTTVVDFVDGILTVRVTNSSLYTLLQQREKKRILSLLRKKFPMVTIRDIFFRMG